MTPPRRIVLSLRDQRPLWAMPDTVPEALRAALPEGWKLVAVDAPADGKGDGGAVHPAVLEAVADAEVYVGFGVPAAVLRAGRRLRWVHSAAAGVGGSITTELLGSQVVLTNSAGIHAEPMADWVTGAVLHFARGFDLALAGARERRWDRAPFDAADAPVREATELTLGVLGLGGIGSAVARRGTALGMRVMATRRRRKPGPTGVEIVAGDGAAVAVARHSDVLAVCVPETPSTRGMVDGRVLDALGPGGVLVNVARGAIVDEAALLERLRDRRLRGAALDVFHSEPLPGDSPFWELPNVLITPHVSATTHRFWQRQEGLIRENLKRYIQGSSLLNRVDPRAGY